MDALFNSRPNTRSRLTVASRFNLNNRDAITNIVYCCVVIKTTSPLRAIAIEIKRKRNESGIEPQEICTDDGSSCWRGKRRFSYTGDGPGSDSRQTRVARGFNKNCK